MATTIDVITNSGQKYIQLRTDVEVTWAGTYQMKYTLQDGSGDTLWSDAFTLAAGGTTRTSTVMFYNPTHDIEPGTTYSFRCVLCIVSSDGTVSESTVWTTAEETTYGVATITYRDGTSSSTVSGSPLTVLSSGLVSPSGWTFVGWATSTYTNSVAYSGGETIEVTEKSNQSITLYAVYYSADTIYCYFGVDMINYTPRTRYRWRWNTGTSSYSTSNYTMNVSYLPTFSTTTITTTTPNRSWTVLGWRTDTSAATAEYSGGETLTSSEIGSLPTSVYAVYSNTVTIYYNSNGGSGSMSNSGGTAYYNTSGNYTKPTITLRTNTFTAPTGKAWKAWSVYADGSGTLYYTEIATNYHTTMYAVWGSLRPDDWAWTSTIATGTTLTITDKKVVFLTADEWLDFIDRIQEFADYLGVTLTSSYITQATSGVSSGSAMTATQGNAARLLINQLSTPTAPPAALTAGTSKIYPAFFNGLMAALNSVA